MSCTPDLRGHDGRGGAEQEGATGDNFVEVKPGVLVDAESKLRLATAGSSGLGWQEANLLLIYDPQLRQDRVLVPPSDEQRALLLMSPLTAQLANEPVVFRSSEDVLIAKLPFSWSLTDDCIRFDFALDDCQVALKRDLIGSTGLPAISDNPTAILAAAIKASVWLSKVRTDDFGSSGYAHVRKRQVRVRPGVAEALCTRAPDQRQAVEDWSVVASRKMGQ